MIINITDREKEIILVALYILSSQCAADELNYELVNSLGGTPYFEEVENLMKKIKD